MTEAKAKSSGEHSLIVMEKEFVDIGGSRREYKPLMYLLCQRQLCSAHEIDSTGPTLTLTVRDSIEKRATPQEPLALSEDYTHLLKRSFSSVMAFRVDQPS